jgi:hypothetical protein
MGNTKSHEKSQTPTTGGAVAVKKTNEEEEKKKEIQAKLKQVSQGNRFITNDQL